MKLSSFSEKELREQLLKLETTSKKILETSGYTKEAKKVLVLQELIREQLTNENISYATSKIR